MTRKPLTPKERVLRWMANKLVRLAKRIDPENEEVLKFWADRMMELVITGQSNIKFSSVDLLTSEPPTG